MLELLSVINCIDDSNLGDLLRQLMIAEARTRLEAANQVYLIIEEAASRGLSLNEALKHVSDYIRYLEDLYNIALSREVFLELKLEEIKASQAAKP